LTQLQTLIDEIPKYQPGADLDLIERAYRFSEHSTKASSARPASPTSPTPSRSPVSSSISRWT